MAFYVDWTEKLQATRRWLGDINNQINNPRNYQRMTGFLNYLFSGANPRNINAIQLSDSSSGTYRPVEIRYIPHKGTSNLITNDALGTCAKIGQRRDLIQTIQPTLYVEDKFTIDEDYVRQNAENGETLQRRLNEEFADCMRVCRESMNHQGLAKEVGLFGANPAAGVGAGTYKTINAIIDSSGKINDNNWDVIKNEQEDNFMSGDVALIGLGNARRYMNRLAVGGLNDNGIDYREVMNQFGMALFKDSDMASVSGDADYVLAIYPGVVQFYQYNLFRGDFAYTATNQLIKGTMPDPVLPITWDYTLKYDDNCDTGNGLQGAWIGRVLAYFDLWNIPETAFGDVYSELNDFNGIVGYKITAA